MSAQSRLDDFLGPEYARIARARKALEEAVADVVSAAQTVEDFGPLGTEELPAAVAALASSEYVDEDESAARWVSRAFTAVPGRTPLKGVATLNFGGNVLMMRMALHDLDEALAAVDRPGPTAPGGTFSA